MSSSQSKSAIQFPVPCAYCGRELDRHSHTWDHIVPLSANGADAKHNLAHACYGCNSLKGSMGLTDFLKSIDRRGPLFSVLPKQKKGTVVGYNWRESTRMQKRVDAMVMARGIVIPARCSDCHRIKPGCQNKSCPPSESQLFNERDMNARIIADTLEWINSAKEDFSPPKA